VIPPQNEGARQPSGESEVERFAGGHAFSRRPTVADRITEFCALID